MPRFPPKSSLISDSKLGSYGVAESLSVSVVAHAGIGSGPHDLKRNESVLKMNGVSILYCCYDNLHPPAKSWILEHSCGGLCPLNKKSISEVIH